MLRLLLLAHVLHRRLLLASALLHGVHELAVPDLRDAAPGEHSGPDLRNRYLQVVLPHNSNCKPFVTNNS